MTGYQGPYRAGDEEARELMKLVHPGEVPPEAAGRERAMGPGNVNRSAAALEADAVAQEAYLRAARKAYAGRWDIIEVFGGFLAVPDGAQVVQSTTIGALCGKLDRMEHKAEPAGDSAVTIDGRRHLKPLDKRYADSWPAEAICSCGEVIRQESADQPWEHTGRKPGEPLG